MRVLITTAILTALVSAGTRATVLVPADLGELTRGARTIARGRVVGVESRWLAGRRGIETIVTLAAESYLKGPLGPTVQFRVPGGQLGPFRNVVVGAPEFSEGQRVIVFLGGNGPRVPWVVGMNQGVFRLVEQRGGWIVRGDPRIQPAPLAAFERDVRALAVAR
jgi:hypothetical protein